MQIVDFDINDCITDLDKGDHPMELLDIYLKRIISQLQLKWKQYVSNVTKIQSSHSHGKIVKFYKQVFLEFDDCLNLLITKLFKLNIDACAVYNRNDLMPYPSKEGRFIPIIRLFDIDHYDSFLWNVAHYIYKRYYTRLQKYPTIKDQLYKYINP